MKPDYVFIGLKGSSQFKIINLHTQAIELFGDAKVNEYRFPYRAPRVQATRHSDQVGRSDQVGSLGQDQAGHLNHATSQAANQPTPPPTTLNAPTETLVARTTSRPDSDRVGRSKRVGSPGQDQVGRSNQVGSPGQDQVGRLN